MGTVCCPEVSYTGESNLPPLEKGIARKDKNVHDANRKKQPTAKKEDFIFLKVIGKGTFGKVLLVQHKKSNKFFAMKVVKKALILQTDNDVGIKAEREILIRIKHPFIMRLDYAFQDEFRLYLVMEFVNGGELFYHLYQSPSNPGRKFDEDRTRFYGA